MGDLSDVYEVTRKEIASLVSSLDEQTLSRTVPATPAWTIRDVIAHLTGDVVCLLASDFPRSFFESLGSESGIRELNEWTHKQVEERKDKPLQDVFDEWERAAHRLGPMIRGETPWPEAIVPFAGYVIVTDLAIHQQDIFGALGLVQDRDSAQVRIGTSTYIGGVELRLQATNGPALRLVTETKDVTCGNGEPQASVRAPRFELFRALSGRRNPDQVRSLEWEGDPEPFLHLFYPYGVRDDALVE